MVFKGQSSLTASELIELRRLLTVLGGDQLVNFLRIYYLVHFNGPPVAGLLAEGIEDCNIQIRVGRNFTDLRREAAYELLELYYLDEYQALEKSTCEGLLFDTQRFLDSPSFATDEIMVGSERAPIVVPL